jgi:3',5'-cyclic AMP phosphodiesterase CpdA
MAIRIAHLSDLHFDGSPELSAGLARLVGRVGAMTPDLVVVSGDLSADGLPSQLDTVRSALAELDPIPRLVIPGNRDLVASSGPPGEAHALPIDSDLDDFLAHEPALSLGLDTADAEQAALAGSSAEERWVDRFGSLEPVVSVAGVHVVGVSSTPRLRSAAIERAARAMRRAPTDALRIFVTHHGLLPVPGRKLRDGDLSHRAGDVLALLFDLGVGLALHGHVHRAHAWLLSDGRHELVVASAGALVNDGRRDASFLEIVAADGRLVIHRRSVATGRPSLLHDGTLRAAAPALS